MNAELRNCEYCGSILENDGIFYGNEYDCGRADNSDYRPPLCYQTEIAALKAVVRELLQKIKILDVYYCFWCGARYDKQHAPDCLGERARVLSE